RYVLLVLLVFLLFAFRLNLTDEQRRRAEIGVLEARLEHGAKERSTGRLGLIRPNHRGRREQQTQDECDACPFHGDARLLAATRYGVCAGQSAILVLSAEGG